MRRLIRADLRRILKKRSVVLLFLFTLFYLIFHVLGGFAAYGEVPFVAVGRLMSRLRLPELLLGLAILFGVYSDDFRSMTYTAVIGRGLSREKLVLAKLLDTLILTVFFYGIIALVLSFLLQTLAGCTLTPTLHSAFWASIGMSVYRTVGYVALASMFLFITGSIPLATITLVLLNIAVPFSAMLFGMNPQVRALHIERIHYAGLAGNAFSDFLFGNTAAGVLKLLLGLVLYLGIVLFVTIRLFNRRELSF